MNWACVSTSVSTGEQRSKCLCVKAGHKGHALLAWTNSINVHVSKTARPKLGVSCLSNQASSCFHKEIESGAGCSDSLALSWGASHAFWHWNRSKTTPGSEGRGCWWLFQTHRLEFLFTFGMRRVQLQTRAHTQLWVAAAVFVQSGHY